MNITPNLYGWQFSETSKCRHRLAPYCQGQGLDIGYGGDPIVPWAVTVDLPFEQQYINFHINNRPSQNLFCGCKDLPFKDNTLEFVFSSHLIEDFNWNEILDILKEWKRILKVNGRIILYQPDQQEYLRYCRKHNTPVNTHHKEADFSLIQFKNKITPYLNVEIIHEFDESTEGNGYSWGIVLNKVL